MDNGNVPGDEKRLRDAAIRDSRIILVTGHGNVGFAKACNLGAQRATAEMLLFLNPDCVLPEGGLTRALAVMQRYPENTLAGCYLANPDGSEQRGSRRALITPINLLTESLGLHWLFKNAPRLNFHHTPIPDVPHEVEVISGAFMLITRAFFRRLTGFDEGYFLHMDDMDLCCRVHQAGGRIICIPEVRVIHFRSTSDVSGAFLEKQKARGFTRYLRTHCKEKYPSALLTAMIAGAWVRYALKVIIGLVDRLFVPPLAAKQALARSILLHRLACYSPQDNSLEGKTILVTRAEQVGLCVIGKALAKGAQVIAVPDGEKVPFMHPRLRWIPYTQVTDVKAEMLIHTASLQSLPATDIRRIILVAYKEEKEAKHALLETFSCPVTLLRPSMTYGVGLDTNITRVADIIRRLGLFPVYGAASGFRNPVQAGDIADAALAVIDNPVTYGRAYDLGGSQSVRYKDILIMLFEYLGRKPNLIALPFLPAILDVLGMIYQVKHLNGNMARRMNTDELFDISDAARDFGYCPHGFLEGEVTI